MQLSNMQYPVDIILHTTPPPSAAVAVSRRPTIAAAGLWCSGLLRAAACRSRWISAASIQSRSSPRLMWVPSGCGGTEGHGGRKLHGHKLWWLQQYQEGGFQHPNEERDAGVAWSGASRPDEGHSGEVRLPASPPRGPGHRPHLPRDAQEVHQGRQPQSGWETDR